MKRRDAAQRAARLLVGRSTHATPDWKNEYFAGPVAQNEVFSLPMIAGMAQSTLKSGAATRTASPSGIRLKIRVNGAKAEDRSPVFVKSGSECG